MKPIRLTILATLLAVFSLSNALASDDGVTMTSGINRTQLVELYTSQGCSSCPPAEAYVSKLKNDSRLWNEIIPLAFHVDYWDYIGWQDPFANKAYSQRQRSHHQQGNISQVYTPGFVINGAEWRGFFARKPINNRVDKEVGVLKAKLNHDKMDVSFEPVNQDVNHAALMLNIAVLGFDIENHIERGENKGLRVTSDFVVIAYQQHDIRQDEQGRYQLNTELPSSNITAPRKGIAVWLSKPNNLQPIQSLGGWL